jgi:hypothetical protein
VASSCLTCPAFFSLSLYTLHKTMDGGSCDLVRPWGLKNLAWWSVGVASVAYVGAELYEGLHNLIFTIKLLPREDKL